MALPQNNFTRRRDILDEMAAMVRDFLFSTVFKDKTDEEYRTAAGLGPAGLYSPTPAMSKKKSCSMIFSSDVPEMCEAADVDMGITLRLPNGDLVTFFPERNFSRSTAAKEDAPTEKRIIELADAYDY